MTLTQLMNKLDVLKIKKVRGKNLWRVIDTNYSGRWEYIAEFNSKEDAEEFIWHRANH